ncbi:ATP-dependent sacrificial sulfur transferase LarE [Methanobacterium sp.]|uniref:ATP-dependent sacrificial sulfur transferase LarE n=1 Tax=Methanobacterium sp. TaxID=2164 RepID=UPI002AB8C5ED|nr:ATP-dependent sacrificial sulfur transferase LarE [Methanobacterium sp.]MDY9923406.1 ATP-dependent sacrificial sulfur transferase LarE [Methanobacterium sp.]
MDIEGKMNSLRNYFHGKKVLIAFSGGADSTLLAWVAKEEANEALAVTVDNGVMPSDCVQDAELIAQKIGIKHLVIHENFLEDSAFEINPPNRCYVCKMKMHQRLEKIAKEGQYDEVVDGTNISDLMEDRPGIMVNIEKNVKTPMVKSGITSHDVRTILNQFNIDYNPSTTCLATRIPTGKAITPRKINRISYAENLIKNLTGLDVVRVRDDDGMALIEVKDVDKLIDRGLLHHLDLELKSVGFKRITMDIGSYGDLKDEMVIYKPCKDAKNKIMFETELPYQFNISLTCQELETLGKVKCSREMGIAMLEMDGRNITIFAKGKIVARKVRDQEDAQELLLKVLPCLRRQI